jgi:hypothetical protein
MKNIWLAIIALLLGIGPVMAQLELRGDSTGKNGIRLVTVNRLNTGKGAEVIVVTRTGKTYKCVIPHFGPDECYQNPDTSLIVMQSDANYVIKSLYQDADLLFLPLMGHEGMHYIYVLKIGKSSISQLKKTDLVYWSIMSRWHFPYVIYDPKRHNLIDFNRKNWNDFKNLTAGVYKLGNVASFKGEIFLQDKKDIDLQLNGANFNKFYHDFIKLYLKRSKTKLNIGNVERRTEPIEKNVNSFNLNNTIYH